MTSIGPGQAGNVRLRFSTREKDIDLEETGPILVPTTFRRYQLSQYVNSQLNHESPVPFEFLINGSFLRTSLDEYLSQNGISAETTLDVEYVRARIPPQFVGSYEHEDWVSDVDTIQTPSGRSRVLSSSYDGHIRVWNETSQVLATSPAGRDNGHLSFVKSAKFITASQIASASFDRTVRLWSFDQAEEGHSAAIVPKLQLFGHKSGVESISAHARSNRLLSASHDHSVGIWSTKKSDAPPAPESLVPKSITKEGKRRKLNPATSIPQRGPLALMQSHTAPVSAAAFDYNDSTVGYSASLDHTVRTWDLVTASLVDTRATNNALFCIEQLPALHLLATGSAGRDVKLIDPRDSATNIIAMSLKGHKNHVVTLARDPGNEFILASGSHDGTCRVWDIRSTSQGKDGVTGQSIYTIPRESLEGSAIPTTGEGVKVFGICWGAELGLLSGGEDKMVQINRGDNAT